MDIDRGLLLLALRKILECLTNELHNNREHNYTAIAELEDIIELLEGGRTFLKEVK